VLFVLVLCISELLNIISNS